MTKSRYNIAMNLPGKRICVVGTSGSGKTHMAGEIARTLNLRHVELDSLHWEPGWVEAEEQVFRRKVAESIQGDAWVIDGNYGKVRDIIWPKADTIVWMNMPWGVVMSRLLSRTFRRAFTKEELWNGNTESLRTTLFSRDSLILWALQTYPKYRREYPTLFAEPAHKHLQVIEFQSPAEANRWLSELSSCRVD